MALSKGAPQGRILPPTLEVHHAPPILDKAHIHPAVRETIAHHHEATLREVQATQHAVVVVGMSGNRDAAGVAHYLEYGRSGGTAMWALAHIADGVCEGHAGWRC